MKVKEIMSKEVIKIRPDASVLEAAKVMAEKKIGSILIEDEEGGEIGILTERDLFKRVIAKGLDSKNVEVKSVMTKPCITIDENTRVEEANHLMHEKNIRRLPVTRDGKIVGMVTIRDIAKSLTFYRIKKMHEYAREVSGSSWG
jgi:CBS domain-containing protein